MAMFLLDVFCLGVKNAMSSHLSRREYKMMLDMNIAESMTPIEACCLKKLVLGAAAYAESLGFSPHEDYAAALMVLEGIDVQDCEAEYTFGRNGKPFYVRGPNESQAESQRIIEQLRQRCGEDGFDFLIGTDMDEEDEEDEENIATIDDPFEVEQLMSDLERALPFEGTFEERGWKRLMKEGHVPPGSSPSVVVEKLSYSGDYGGILCHLADNGVICSLTHLRFPLNFPFLRNVTAYQKRRVKKLKRQEKEWRDG
ncbi:MAG: hypothetical protein JO189_05330 [Deltaproteobacteria bacterium]|nr:hypothetical protein [Deltaproteobacteria bacterium]